MANMADNKIDIKILRKKKYNLKISIGNVKESGVTIGMINGLRRIMLSEIETIAFNPTDIIIEKNTSYYDNNTKIKELRIGLLPIIKFNKKIKEDDVITMNLKVKNANESLLQVTTDYCEFYINGTLIKDVKYKNKISLLLLGQNEEIRLIATASRNIAKEHIRWSVVNVIEYEYDDVDDKPILFKLGIESNKVHTSKYIFKKACDVFINKVNLFLDFIEENLKDTDEYYTTVYNGENHTLAYLINDCLIDNLEFIAVKIPYPNELRFFIIMKNKNLKQIVIREIQKTIKIIENIRDHPTFK
jgi:DNA-directed RNA polymerase subunit L